MQLSHHTNLTALTVSIEETLRGGDCRAATRMTVMVCLDLCQWSSLSVVLWFFEAHLLQSDRGFSAQARPKQALHDTSLIYTCILMQDGDTVGLSGGEGLDKALQLKKKLLEFDQTRYTCTCA